MSVPAFQFENVGGRDIKREAVQMLSLVKCLIVSSRGNTLVQGKMSKTKVSEVSNVSQPIEDRTEY